MGCCSGSATFSKTPELLTAASPASPPRPMCGAATVAEAFCEAAEVLCRIAGLLSPALRRDNETNPRWRCTKDARNMCNAPQMDGSASSDCLWAFAGDERGFYACCTCWAEFCHRGTGPSCPPTTTSRQALRSCSVLPTTCPLQFFERVNCCRRSVDECHIRDALPSTHNEGCYTRITAAASQNCDDRVHQRPSTASSGQHIT